MKSQQFQKYSIPEKPGVYFFRKGDSILYIGKATNLKQRTRSYFANDLVETRSVLINDMVVLSDNLTFIQTDTALEALILEAQLIKKYTPKYNTKEKDNKSFNYVVITRDRLPRVELIRGRNLKIQEILGELKPKYVFGPFTSGNSLKEGLRIIRKIFPYIDTRSLHKDKHEFYKQLGLTPDTENSDAVKKYTKNISYIVAFFKGNKKSIIKELEEEMMKYARKQEFEKAHEIKNQLFALTHINETALIKNDFFDDEKYTTSTIRIEGYDIAHMSGKNMVGVMTVIINGNTDKSEYKKFTITSQKNAHDTGALYEVLMRRFKHREWGLPDLVVTDGGVPQMTIAKQVLDFYQLSIPIVSVLKDEHHRPKDILGSPEDIKKYKKEILLVNSEAHRFSISFHKETRAKNFIKKK